MTLGAKPQPYSGSNFCFFHNPGSSSGSFRKRAGSRSGSVKFEVKSEVKDEVKLEVKRQNCAAANERERSSSGRSARFLRGNPSETRFLRGYRQEGFFIMRGKGRLLWGEPTISFQFVRGNVCFLRRTPRKRPDTSPEGFRKLA